MVAFLLDHGADIEATAEDGQSALYIAANSKDWDLVDYLLSRGFSQDVAIKTVRSIIQ